MQKCLQKLHWSSGYFIGNTFIHIIFTLFTPMCWKCCYLLKFHYFHTLPSFLFSHPPQILTWSLCFWCTPHSIMYPNNEAHRSFATWHRFSIRCCLHALLWTKRCTCRSILVELRAAAYRATVITSTLKYRYFCEKLRWSLGFSKREILYPHISLPFLFSLRCVSIFLIFIEKRR